MRMSQAETKQFRCFSSYADLVLTADNRKPNPLYSTIFPKKYRTVQNCRFFLQFALRTLSQKSPSNHPPYKTFITEQLLHNIERCSAQGGKSYGFRYHFRWPCY